MSAKHTPEPWTLLGRSVNNCSISNHSVIRDQGGTPIGYIAYSDDASRAIACVNACAGIADPAEAIREARGALFALLAVRKNGDVPSWTAQWDDAEAALAKLQPKGAK